MPAIRGSMILCVGNVQDWGNRQKTPAHRRVYIETIVAGFASAAEAKVDVVREKRFPSEAGKAVVWFLHGHCERDLFISEQQVFWSSSIAMRNLLVFNLLRWHPRQALLQLPWSAGKSLSPRSLDPLFGTHRGRLLDAVNETVAFGRYSKQLLAHCTRPLPHRSIE